MFDTNSHPSIYVCVCICRELWEAKIKKDSKKKHKKTETLLCLRKKDYVCNEIQFCIYSFQLVSIDFWRDDEKKWQDIFCFEKDTSVAQ